MKGSDLRSLFPFEVTMLYATRRWFIAGIIFASSVCLMGCSQDKSVKKGTDTNLKKLDFKPSGQTAPTPTNIIPGKK
jgi:hypothetical protein